MEEELPHEGKARHPAFKNLWKIVLWQAFNPGFTLAFQAVPIAFSRQPLYYTKKKLSPSPAAAA